jgi:hypothetical protein
MAMWTLLTVPTAVAKVEQEWRKHAKRLARSVVEEGTKTELPIGPKYYALPSPSHRHAALRGIAGLLELSDAHLTEVGVTSKING